MTDPYFDVDTCARRLMSEYMQHKSLIVAVDFDDTVYDFHRAGHDYGQVLDLVRRCQVLGFHIVLFTGTHPDRYPEQVQYLAERDIDIKFINCNPIPLPFGNHGKMYFNILLDDRSGIGQAFHILSTVVSEIERGIL